VVFVSNSVLTEASSYAADDAIALVREIATILHYLVTRTPPIVHRDLKPSNLMVRDDGTLALLDFGAVRECLRDPYGATMGVGTYAYMAPEQFEGEAFTTTDVFGLGKVAVHLLTGERPRQREARWAAPESLAREMRVLLDEMLDEDPHARP
jgi:serine/threonine protein kinase